MMLNSKRLVLRLAILLVGWLLLVERAKACQSHEKQQPNKADAEFAATDDDFPQATSLVNETNVERDDEQQDADNDQDANESDDLDELISNSSDVGESRFRAKAFLPQVPRWHIPLWSQKPVDEDKYMAGTMIHLKNDYFLIMLESLSEIGLANLKPAPDETKVDDILWLHAPAEVDVSKKIPVPSIWPYEHRNEWRADVVNTFDKHPSMRVIQMKHIEFSDEKKFWTKFPTPEFDFTYTGSLPDDSCNVYGWAYSNTHLQDKRTYAKAPLRAAVCNYGECSFRMGDEARWCPGSGMLGAPIMCGSPQKITFIITQQQRGTCDMTIWNANRLSLVTETLKKYL